MEEILQSTWGYSDEEAQKDWDEASPLFNSKLSAESDAYTYHDIV